MGVSELVFPGLITADSRTRWVLHTAALFLEQLQRCQGRALPDEQRAMVSCAALLHDVGHGPLSHVFEEVTSRAHERWTLAIIQDPETHVHQCLRAYDREMPEEISPIFQRRERGRGHNARGSEADRQRPTRRGSLRLSVATVMRPGRTTAIST
jgi:HD superfamily phosphohydrolase